MRLFLFVFKFSLNCQNKSSGANTQTDQLGVLISTELHDKHISLTDYDDKTQIHFFFLSPLSPKVEQHHTNFFWMGNRFPPVAIHC
jgi:hypothetical protein